MPQVTLTVRSLSDNKVVLEGQRQSACSSCASKETCVTVSHDQSKLLRAELEANDNYAVGQQISLHCQDSFLLKAVLVMLGPALLGLVGGALLFNLLFASIFPELVDYLTFCGSAIGFVSGLILSRRLGRSLKQQLKLHLSLKATN
ncbi:SoxR reducing system RseC family protein [Agarivorans gilvus]|uniref:Fis family transcriptional regulator n=1 Tax=Agarivorans gilvus TaxID=680279 RepID=A0ABQ1I5G9_9ALTE|nr:SoxR reducing system RseC family protein [Agarivorans gilvus]GGB18292.1 hypothetical protein GCM10007414_34650 [Agarivorans gilvus]